MKRFTNLLLTSLLLSGAITTVLAQTAPKIPYVKPGVMKKNKELSRNSSMKPMTADSPEVMKSTTVAAVETQMYKFETVPNDPLGVKHITLANGLQVYLSVNKNEPRIQTFIATRAGSKNDPTDATGLAHYLEHMLFKGTSRIGTLNWEKEKAVLKRISDLYEKRRSVQDPEERKKIYAEIDAASQEAASFVVANEYDKMMSSIGAKGTNAFTSLERTCYVNDIPSNELEKWCAIESERMNELVLRLFHTELEAVYEEFNIGQDNDGRKVYKAMMESLFPTHTYGTQTTLGTGDHLKNPSMEKIHQFFDKYYVPNNMAIILSGDLDPDKTVATLEKYFGKWQKKGTPTWTAPVQAPITAPIVKEVIGNEKASLQIGYRCGGSATPDPIMMGLCAALLNNGQAGIIDLNLLQKQKVLKANAYAWELHDYSMFMMNGTPRDGQTLEEVRDLLLEQMEKLKKGEFEDWLIKAAVKNAKLEQIKASEQNRARTAEMLDAFILDKKWKDMVTYYDRMEKITKAEVVAFANKNFGNNYALIFKRQGEDKNVAKVEKPKITPIKLNRTDESAFQQNFKTMQSNALTPKFIDFKKDIANSKLPSGVGFDYIHNSTTPTFDLYYTLDMGKNHDRTLPVAIKLLPYLGTNKYTADQLHQEFFKLGLTFDVFSSDDRVYVNLSGLEESFEEGVKLFEHILQNVKPDQTSLNNVVADILKSRYDALNDKRTILRGAMANYAKYGKLSAFTDNISEEDLKKLKAEDMVAKIKAITSFEHTVFYYGTKSNPEVKTIVAKYHLTPAKLTPVPAETKYSEVETDKNKVFFVNFPMVQAELMMMSKADKFDVNKKVMADLYNDYFGAGLSSIMFQEIREAKALAYSTFATYSAPQYADRSHYMQAYVGTQVDKLQEAVKSVQAIVNEMPVSAAQIENARGSILKKIESERITKSDIYWTYQNAKKQGLDRDIRSDAYAKMKVVTPEELVKFQKENVKGRNYTFLVLGDKTKVDMEYLKTIGEVQELSLKDVFGYARP